MTKLLLLDCDGTIREPASGGKFIQHPSDQRIIKGADQALAHYHKNEWQIVGITNQGGVAAGHKTIEDAIEEQLITLELFPEIEGIFFCPDERKSGTKWTRRFTNPLDYPQISPI
jgi:D-glycero-D-manno-heptose 1,7-bisphosphate phosphatase